MSGIEYKWVKDNLQSNKDNLKMTKIDLSKIPEDEAKFIISLNPEFTQEKEDLFTQDITKRASLAQEINTDMAFDWEKVKNQAKKVWEKTGEAMKEIWKKMEDIWKTPLWEAIWENGKILRTQMQERRDKKYAQSI